jgi:hypothetical protein
MSGHQRRVGWLQSNILNRFHLVPKRPTHRRIKIMCKKSFIILAEKKSCIVVKLCEQNTFALKAFFDIASEKQKIGRKMDFFCHIQPEKN